MKRLPAALLVGVCAALIASTTGVSDLVVAVIGVAAAVLWFAVTAR